MSTDFSYGGKQIVISGPIKPGGQDMPSDARTRVESYADIASIPNPHVGLKITVKVDETNNNKMTDYIVKSLKADSIGVANSLIDEVVRYVDYLEVSGGGSVSQEAINTAFNNYLTEHPVQSGATAEQVAQIQANKTAIGDSNSGLIKEVNDIKNINLENLNTAIQTLETLVGVDETLGDKSGLPEGDANVIASINRIDNKTTSGGTGLTSEQAQQLTTAYNHSQSTHVQASDIPTKTSDLTNDSGFLTSIPSEYITDSEMSLALSTKANTSDIPSLNGYATETFVTNKIAEAQLSSGEGLTSEQSNQLTIAYTHSQTPHVSADDIPTKLSELQNDSSYTTSTDVQSIVNNAISSSGNINIRSINTGEIFVLSGSVPETKFGEIVVSSSSLSINEGSSSTFTVKLDSEPTSVQTINLSVNNSNCSIDNSSLTFTSNNYSTSQTVTVTTTQDSSSYDNKTSVITLSGDNVSSKTVTVNIINIDVRTTYTVTNNLTNVTSNNSSSSVTENSSYTATLTAEDGYKLDTVTVTMGDTDITSSAYSNKVINISQVTGNIVITATAIKNVAASNLLVSYNFIPENAIYDNSDGNNNVIVRNEAGETHDWKFISSNATSGYNPTNNVITSEGLCLKEDKKTQSVQISDTNIFNGNAMSLEVLFYVDDKALEAGNLWTTNSNFIFAGSNSNGMGTKTPLISVSTSNKQILQTSIPYNSRYDATVTLNSWNVLTVTNPNETNDPAKIFINGQLVNTCQYGTYIDNTTEGYMLGTRYAIVRRFKIYNEVLSEDTVLSNAESYLSEVNN